jgi:hypothetical protein
MRGWILGFDLSLAAPAAAALPLDWRPGDWKRVRTFTHYPIAPKTDDLRGQLVRYQEIANWACDVAAGLGGPGRRPQTFVESYGFSKNTANASRLMESGGIVKMALFSRFGIVMQPVNASTARKLLLGKVPKGDGRGNQKLAVQFVLDRAGAPKQWDENICDAVCVANAGLSAAGGVALSAPNGSPPSGLK